MKAADIAIVALVALVGLLGAAAVFLPSWEAPPVVAEQTGYRGTAMVEIANEKDRARLKALNEVPELYPQAEPGGEPVSEIYENIQVLGGLNDEQFFRIMAAITEWVSPEEGCVYCHDEENFASDDVYTKVVARKMLEMTREINGGWTDHVGTTGVTCYTCHRGHPVPQEVWFNDPGPRQAKGMAGYRGGQNSASHTVGNTSLHYDPFTPLFEQGLDIRVEGPTSLPTGHDVSLQDTERSYSLMIHLSESLGVNCTFCHNTRAFSNWGESTPQRETAWQGIQMVRDLNASYLAPLSSIFPPDRLGPHGDSLKINCGTCHQGVQKPLFGAKMLADFPSLE